MKVIITNRFDKIYLKYNTKYFNANELSENLKDKHFNFISLHHPYFKFKIKIDSVSFR